MMNEREEIGRCIRIAVGDDILEQVEKVVYLGCVFSKVDRYTTET